MTTKGQDMTTTRQSPVDAEHVARLRAAAGWLLNMAEDDSSFLRKVDRANASDGAADTAIQFALLSAHSFQRDAWEDYS